MGNHAEPNEVSGYSTGNYAGYQPGQNTDDQNNVRTVAPTTVGCWKKGEECSGNPDTDSKQAPVTSDVKGHENLKIINDNLIGSDPSTCDTPPIETAPKFDVVDSDSDMTVDLQSSEESNKIEGFANTNMFNNKMVMFILLMLFAAGLIFVLNKKKKLTTTP